MQPYPDKIFSRTLDNQHLPLHMVHVGFGAGVYRYGAEGSTSLNYRAPAPDDFEFPPYGYDKAHGFLHIKPTGFGRDCGEQMWPFMTAYPGMHDWSCYEAMWAVRSSSQGFITEVVVPLTASTVDGSTPLVFHDWTLSGSAADGQICSTGNLGIQRGELPTAEELQIDPYGVGSYNFTRGVQASFYRPTSGHIPGSLPLYPDGSRGPVPSDPTSVTAVYAPPTPDVSAPVVTVRTPQDCQAFEQHEQVPVEFFCEDPRLSGEDTTASCTGPVADGELLDTSTPGVHEFTVTGVDVAGNARTSTVRYRVVATNTVPQAADDAFTTVGTDRALQVPAAAGVLANDSDVDGDALVAALVSEPEHGNVVLDEDGSFVYTPEEDFVGQDSFTYTAGDGTGVSEPATVTLTVEAGCAGRAATLVGTAGSDRLIGTDGADVIVGLGGDDLVLAGAGDDVVCAGSGEDAVNADVGDDMVVGGSGGDRLRGDEGDDQLEGGTGDDVLLGDAGDDVLTGGAGSADVCRGGGGSNSSDGSCERSSGIG